MRVRAPLFLVLSCSLAACADVPRPTAPERDDPVLLEVEVVAPVMNEILIAGRTSPVHVRTREAGGRVHGVGFVARAAGGGATTAVDSALAEVGPLADTTIAFQLRLPPTLPNGIQVDIYGFALGPTGQSTFSAPRHVRAYVCPPGAAWC